MIGSFLTVLKIGGNILNDETTLSRALDEFARLSGPKILVHGGGRAATDLAERFDIPQKMIEGRRVTDEQTLQVAIMVYGGLINKTLVAKLQARGTNAIGIGGADLDVIRAKRRSPDPIDYGWVGDVTTVRGEALLHLLNEGATPVIAPLSHDGNGTLLNTNADTIAQEVACALAKTFPTRLVYSFEMSGVLESPSNPDSVIPTLTCSQFEQLRSRGLITGGMVPKLDNAFKAIQRGIRVVMIGKADRIGDLISGSDGTRCVHEE